MGYIIEPEGVDFIVGPSVLTDEDKAMVNLAITHYRKTGEMLTAANIDTIKDEGLSETEMELLKSAYKEALLIKDGKLKGSPASELWND